MNPARTASVLVVSYRPGDWLRACLTSVVTQVDEVIVVDNGSSGGEAGDIGEEMGARVIRLPTNTGFVGGVNAALAKASTDLVGLLNDDATAAPGWLDAAAEVLADPSVAAVAPKILFAGTWAQIDLDDKAHQAPGDARSLGTPIVSLTVGGIDRLADALGGLHALETEHDPVVRRRWTNAADPFHVPMPSEGAEIRINDHVVQPVRIGDVVNNAGSYLSKRGFGGDYGFETADDGRFDTAADRFGVTGAAMVTRRATFERLGPLAGDFFAYYEDLDWSWRARLAGLRIRYEPSATIRHRRSATTGARSTPLLELLGARNRLLCLVRNAPLGLARREAWAALAAEDRPSGLRRSLAGHLPYALAARASQAHLRRIQPAQIMAAWAGRDNSWGLASQASPAPQAGGSDGR